MRFELATHPGLILIDPDVQVVQTIDDDINDTFTPHLLFINGESRIYHVMPPQPYVNGTWTNATRDNAVRAYLESIALG